MSSYETVLKTIMKTDVYKIGHKSLYPGKLEKVFSNFTPRSGNWANTDLGFVVADGMSYVVANLKKEWEDNFFKQDKSVVETALMFYISTAKRVLGVENFDIQHFRDLYALGELPLEFRAVAEGTHVPYKTPVLTVHNTDPKFAWLVNYLETIISAELWPIITASTKAYGVKEQLLRFARETGVPAEEVDYQGNDFSFRGMEGSAGAKQVGIGHLQHFKGSDNLPAILATGKGESVIATEHSIMSSGTKEGELETYRRLIADNQKGILSLVSDTWNIYNVVNVIMPTLKKEILARDGQFVVRPDSGDPIEVLLGGAKLTHPDATAEDQALADKGLFKLIEEHFGFATNANGFKVLPIGFLWGDGMTPDAIENVFSALKAAGYASSCLAIGIGSYMYQLNTRDTYGFAMKATYVEIDGKPFNITKDPITDSGVKKSAKGLLAIIDGKLVEETTWEVVQSKDNELAILD